MANATMERIIESNRLKKEACDNCMKSMSGRLTPEQLKKFEECFYSAANGYIFSRKTR